MTLNQIPPAVEEGAVQQNVEERITATGTWAKPDGVDSVEIILVAGGGAGGSTQVPVPASPNFRSYTGGGGGGAIVRRHVPVSGPVPVTIGAGGVATPFTMLNNNGGDTVWGSGPDAVVAFGGGAGGHGVSPASPLGLGRDGGTGGGGGYGSDPAPTFRGIGGAGGGAVGAARTTVSNPVPMLVNVLGGNGSQGGVGSPAGPSRSSPAEAGVKNSVGGRGWNGLGGGGGGGGFVLSTSVGQSGGGSLTPAGDYYGALANTGGGGAGAPGPPTGLHQLGQSGGSGLIIVRYSQ